VLRYLWHVRRRAHADLADTSMHRSRRFRLDADESSKIAYQIDGDYGGTLPVDVEILPGELRLLVSQDAARRLGFELPRHPSGLTEARSC
jgi:diacylglycerol kinase family enzyme